MARLLRAPFITMLVVFTIASLLHSAEPDARDSTDGLRSELRQRVDGVIRGARPGDAPAKLQKWLDANAETFAGVVPSGLEAQPWGTTALRPAGDGQPTRIYLHVFDWHVGGKLTAYGLTGGVRRAYLHADPKRADLPFVRLNRSLVITVPKRPPDPLATVVVLETDDKLESAPIVARPDDDGRITMHARDAIIHGRTLRYEPEPHKDTVGYWSDPKDWVSWDFDVTRPGTYDVEILQGCAKNSGGSKVDFAVGEQVWTVVVEDTGGFQNFVRRGIGKARFDKPGRYTLTVKPKGKAGVAVMDLREVTLSPGRER